MPYRLGRRMAALIARKGGQKGGVKRILVRVGMRRPRTVSRTPAELADSGIPEQDDGTQSVVGLDVGYRAHVGFGQ